MLRYTWKNGVYCASGELICDEVSWNEQFPLILKEFFFQFFSFKNNVNVLALAFQRFFVVPAVEWVDKRS
jgi:hypothetical protein